MCSGSIDFILPSPPPAAHVDHGSSPPKDDSSVGQQQNASPVFASRSAPVRGVGAHKIH